MRKIALLVVIMCSWTTIIAQNYDFSGAVATITDATAGCISSKNIIPDNDKPKIVELRISGSIDASDFAVMRDRLTNLSVLDLNHATIAAYNGTKGTYLSITTYNANVFPISAFENRPNIKKVVFPPSLTSIDRFAFYNAGITAVTTLPSTLISIGEGAFTECDYLADVTLPSSLRTIGSKAFSHNPLLPSIFIPASVNSIGEGAFESCDNLLDVFVESSDPQSTSLYSSSFNDASKKNLHVPIKAGASYSDSAPWNSFSKIVEGVRRPTVSTEDFYDITATSATVDIIISDLGDMAPTNHGVIWSSSTIPTVDLPTKTDEGSGAIGYYIFKISHLEAGTTYSVRGYATNNAGTSYGNILTFQTPPSSVTINGTSATIDGATAGCLVGTTVLTDEQKTSITSLIVSGTLDARDFKVIRDNMTALISVDLTNTTIAGYIGPNGTSVYTGDRTYAANHLPESSFADRPNLTYVGIPSSITTIDMNAFKNCTGITTITLPETLTTIAFRGFFNTGLTSITFPNSVNRIENQAFYVCSKLTSISLPGSVVFIGYNAFTSCNALSSVSISSSVTTIETEAFTGCPNLKQFTVDSNNPTYCSIDGVFFTKDAKTLLIYPNKHSSIYTIPSSVTTVASNAFNTCINLSSITIPISVTSIGTRAFSSCNNLSSINVYSNSPVNLSSSTAVFESVPTGTCVLRVPSGSLDSYLGASQWNGFTNIVEGFFTPVVTTQAVSGVLFSTAIGNGAITSLGDVSSVQYGFVWSTSSKPTVSLTTKTALGTATSTKAFTSSITGLNSSTTYYVRAYATSKARTSTEGLVCDAGTVYGEEVSFTTKSASVSINGTSATIDGATAGCLVGTTVLTDDQKKTITNLIVSGTLDARDFKVIRDNMTALVNLDLTNISIAAYTGTEGTNQPTANVSYPVNELPAFALYYGSRFQTIVLPASLASMGYYSLAACTSMAAIDLPSTVTSIKKGAIAGCSKLQSITIPSSVTAINAQTFQSCTGLSSVAIPSSVMLIDSSAFSSCSNLTTINIPSSVKTISIGAFSSCSKLTSITLPSSITAIGYSVFNSCSALTTVILPSGISKIEANTFTGCSSLTSIAIPSSVTSIDNGAFKSCSKLTTVDMPASLKTIGSNAFDGCSSLTTITIPSSVTVIDKYAFYNCPNLASVGMPSSLLFIGEAAFASCANLTIIDIPSTVTTIGNYAFFSCSKLGTIKAYPSTPVNLSSSTMVFTSVPTSTCILRVPAGSLTSYKAANQWSAFTNIVEGVVAPTVTTQAVTHTTPSSAIGNGTISGFGDANPVQYGIVWSTSPKPTVDLSTKTALGVPTKTGAFTTTLTGLNTGTTYYARAYATNTATSQAAGTVYGNEHSFVANYSQLTLSSTPVVDRKLYDGTTVANLIFNGELSGVAAADVGNVSFTTTATYDNASCGTNKTVTVKYTLTGSASSYYLAPADYVLKNGEIDKRLDLTILLEGLWNANSLKMNKSKDFNVTNDLLVDKYPSNISESITLELHGSPYSKIDYMVEDLKLHQDGTVTTGDYSAVALPPSLSGDYYLTVKSRNHLPAVSASRVSFSGNSISFDFTDKETKAYASDFSRTPTKNANNKWLLLGGNIVDEDSNYQEINMEDLYAVFNKRSGITKQYGYQIYDLDGNGDIDLNDVYIVFNNRDAILYIP